LEGVEIRAEGAASRRCRRQGGWDLGRGISPSPVGWGLERGLCPLPRIVFRFLPENGAFWCIL